MRKDAKLDKKQIHLPNASLLGYSRGTAKVGDYVIWNDNGQRRACRYVARVAHASALGAGDTHTPEIRDWMMLLVLNNSISSLWVRWVPPHEIEECFRPDDWKHRIESTLSLFMDADLSKKSAYDIAASVGA